MAPPDAGEEWEDVVGSPSPRPPDSQRRSWSTTTPDRSHPRAGPVPGTHLCAWAARPRPRPGRRPRRPRRPGRGPAAGVVPARAWSAPPTDPTVVRPTSPYAAQVLNPPPRLVIPEGEERAWPPQPGLVATSTAHQALGPCPARPARCESSGPSRGTRRRLFPTCAPTSGLEPCGLGLPSWSHMSGPVGQGRRDRDLDVLRRQPRPADRARRRPDQVPRPSSHPAGPSRPGNWVRRVGDRGPSPLLPESANGSTRRDSTFSVDLARSRDDEGEPGTTITITRGPAGGWLDDMETYWAYQLSIADHAGLGVPDVTPQQPPTPQDRPRTGLSANCSPSAAQVGRRR